MANQSIWIAGAALTFLGTMLANKFKFFVENSLASNSQIIIGALFIISIGCAISIVFITNSVIANQRLIKTCYIKQEIEFLQKDSLELSDLIDMKESKLYFKLLFESLWNLNYLNKNDKDISTKAKDKSKKKGNLIKHLFVLQICLFMLAIILLFVFGIYMRSK